MSESKFLVAEGDLRSNGPVAPCRRSSERVSRTKKARVWEMGVEVGMCCCLGRTPQSPIGNVTHSAIVGPLLRGQHEVLSSAVLSI